MNHSRSLKQEIKEGLEIDKLNSKLEEPHLSGAYIRSLVKQLSSSRTKDPMNNPKDQECEGDGLHGRNKTKFKEEFSETQETQPPQQLPQHKKQVRRRLHTSRPYQERLLNMAEARREIVTALKFHRASMKQAGEQRHHQEQEQEQQQRLQPQSPQPPSNSYLEQEGRVKSRRNPRIYPSSTSNSSNYMENNSFPSAFSSSVPPPTPNAYPWSPSPISPLLVDENPNFTLPNQTLGLNLNFQHFNNLDATLFYISNNPSIYPTASLSSSSSSSPSISLATDQEFPNSLSISQEGGPSVASDVTDSSVLASGSGGDLHVAVDDEEMAEIRSLGEQHQMEWSDTVNLVTSARWFRFLKGMERGEQELKPQEDFGYHPFDEVMEFPAWLNANESCLQQHLNDYCSDNYSQDPALPCLDIGEIEGMDGEWFA